MRRDISKTATHEQLRLRRRCFIDFDNAWFQYRHHRGMIFQDGKFTFHARDNDSFHFAGEEKLFRRDELERKSGHRSIILGLPLSLWERVACEASRMGSVVEGS